MDFTPEFEIGGYAEVRFAYEAGVSGVPWNLYERVRPSFKIAPAPRITAEAVVEGALVQGRDTTKESIDLLDASELGPLLGASGCSFTESTGYTQASDYLSVERLHVDFNLPALDLSVGRQALRWGSGLAFHPTDVYSESLLSEPWREPRGVNAVKATIPVGESQVVAALIMDDDLSGMYPAKNESGTFEGVPASGAVRATVRALGTDFTGITTVSGDDGEWFGGWDLRGNLEVGWWVEGGYHSATKSVENVVGVDYSFDVLDSLYIGAEYRYDGSGADPGDYDFTQRLSGSSVTYDCPGADTEDPQYTIDPDLTSVSSNGTARQTLGKHYVAGAIRLAVNRDITVTTSGLVNAADGSGLLIPDAQFNVGQRLALHLGGQIPFGKDGTEFNPSATDLSIHVTGPGTNATADLSSLVPAATIQAWARYSF